MPMMRTIEKTSSVVSQKSLDNRGGLLAGFERVGLEPVGTETKWFRQAPTLGTPTQGVGVVAIKPPAY
jgi:hypothetical protein